MNDKAKKVVVQYDYPRIRYICPKCKKVIEFKKKMHGIRLCTKCGQYLDWSDAKDIYFEAITALDPDEAAWLGNLYYHTGPIEEKDWMDIDEWRHSLKGRGVELYFLFKDSKSHGKFMRKFAKEAPIYDG